MWKSNDDMYVAT